MNCDCKHCDPWMMPAENYSAQNQIRGLNPDSTTHSSGEPVIECDPSLPETTSEEEEVQSTLYHHQSQRLITLQLKKIQKRKKICT